MFVRTNAVKDDRGPVAFEVCSMGTELCAERNWLLQTTVGCPALHPCLKSICVRRCLHILP